MSSKKGRGCSREPLGEFVWVLSGRTLHPARLALPRDMLAPPVSTQPTVEIQWTQTGFFQMVPRESIQFQEGRRPRRKSAVRAKEASKTPTKRKSTAKRSIKDAAKTKKKTTTTTTATTPQNSSTKESTNCTDSTKPSSIFESASTHETTADAGAEKLPVCHERLLQDDIYPNSLDSYFADNVAADLFPRDVSAHGKLASALTGKSNCQVEEDYRAKIEDLSTSMVIDEENLDFSARSNPLSSPSVDDQSHKKSVSTTKCEGKSDDDGISTEEPSSRMEIEIENSGFSARSNLLSSPSVNKQSETTGQGESDGGNENSIEGLSASMAIYEENAGFSAQSNPLSSASADEQSSKRAVLETKDEGAIDVDNGIATDARKGGSGTPPLSPLHQEFADSSVALDTFATKSVTQDDDVNRTDEANKSVVESGVLDSLAAARGLVVSKFLGLYNSIRGSSSG